VLWALDRNGVKRHAGAASAIPDYPQFPQVYPQPLSGRNLFEPPNLWARWKSLWITLCG